MKKAGAKGTLNGKIQLSKTLSGSVKRLSETQELIQSSRWGFFR